MPVREIVLLGDPILREKAPEVETFDEELHSLVQDMFITMAAAEGAGLAAPQVGIRKRVLVADVDTEGEEPVRVALVNPIIVEVSTEEDRSSEGCLSVPGVTEVVSRPDAVISIVRDNTFGIVSKKIQSTIPPLKTSVQKR